jgi:hypothetical protein
MYPVLRQTYAVRDKSVYFHSSLENRLFPPPLLVVWTFLNSQGTTSQSNFPACEGAVGVKSRSWILCVKSLYSCCTSHGKWPIYRWFTYYKWWFSMAMLNNKMVHWMEATVLGYVDHVIVIYLMLSGVQPWFRHGSATINQVTTRSL